MSLTGCPAPTKGNKAEAPAPIVIGFIGSLTGRSASFGTSAKNGVELALELVSGRGGSSDPKVKAIYLDDQGRPEDARQAAQRLITKERVKLILGPLESTTAIAVTEIAERAQVPLISPSSTLPSLTRSGSFAFRVCYTDDFQGRAMARFAKEKLGLGQVAILRAVNNEYSVELSNVFAKELERLGGQVVIDEAYVTDDPDLELMLKRVLEAKPEAVFIPGFYDEVRRIAPAARRVGLDVPLLGGDGWDSDRLLGEDAAAVEGSYFTTHFHPEHPGPGVAAFVAAYEKEFNETPDALAALAYDAAQVALLALSRPKALTDGNTLRAALAGTGSHVGVTGVISFNETGDAEKSAVVLRIEGGRRVYVTSIGPGEVISPAP
jgi:branched-chain amino acid transport system substrate-binding protein